MFTFASGESGPAKEPFPSSYGGGGAEGAGMGSVYTSWFSSSSLFLGAGGPGVSSPSTHNLM